MAEIKTSFGEGGSGINTEDRDGVKLSGHLRDQVDDVTELRTQFIALLAKLDADAGVTDADYAATLTPAAQTATKG